MRIGSRLTRSLAPLAVSASPYRIVPVVATRAPSQNVPRLCLPQCAHMSTMFYNGSPSISNGRFPVSHLSPDFFYRFTRESNVDIAEVSKNGGILLANLLQGSSSTFSRVSFPSPFAFQEGMWDTHISALLSSPTVSGGFSRRF